VSQFQQKNPTGPLLWPLAPALLNLLPHYLVKLEMLSV